MAVWIGDIYFDPEVEAKINEKHNVTRDQVFEAVALGYATGLRWNDHPVYGRRLMATGVAADGTDVLAILRPIDALDGSWECMSAWMI